MQFDPYTLKARIYPALLLILPAVGTAVGCFPGSLDGLTALASLLVFSGFVFVAAQLIRQVAKRREEGLWRRWGGSPTTVALRWRTADSVGTQPIIRSRLGRAVPDVTLPTEEEEKRDPSGADAVYEALVTSLRERTRDVAKFPVVFGENVIYGFRRNSWAIRWIGLVIGIGSMVVALVALDEAHWRSPLLWVAATIDVLMVGFWSLVTSEKWVQEAAESYRDALFSAAAALVADR